MTLTLKLTNRESEGGLTARVKTYDVTDKNNNGRVEKTLAGEILIAPGEDAEICVTAGRIFSVEEINPKKESTLDALDSPVVAAEDGPTRADDDSPQENLGKAPRNARKSNK